jgi:hypothetical protein
MHQPGRAQLQVATKVGRTPDSGGPSAPLRRFSHITEHLEPSADLADLADLADEWNP